jgi:oligoribonuclease
MKNLLWLDLEMTGTDPSVHRIIEIGALFTDEHLNEVVCLDLAIGYPDLDSHPTDPWCIEQHEKNGLWESIKKQGVSLKEGEERLKAFTERHCKRSVVLAGNSIFHDRKFLEQCMPEFSKLLHYRMLDVTSLMIFMKHFHINPIKKKKLHRALPDIRESLAEYQHYLKKVSQLRISQ